jgi:hypothetical protein
MSDEDDQMTSRRGRKPKPQKLFKVEINIFDDGTTHLQCVHFKEEGPCGKLFPWRITPDEFLTLIDGGLSDFEDYIKSYEDTGKESEKPVRIGIIKLNIDTAYIIDPDYILYEEYGPNNKLRPTRPGITEFKRCLRLQVGDLVDQIIGGV